MFTTDLNYQLKISNLKNIPEFNYKIALLNLIEWADTFKHEFNIKTISEFIEYNSKTDCYVLHQNKQFIGTISIVPNDLVSLYPQYINWISSVYIDKKYRGKGFLKLLLDWIISKSNYNILYLWCKKDLESMYAKYGFKTIHNLIYLDKPICIMYINISNYNK